MRVLGPLGRDGGGTWAGRVGPFGAAVGAALRRATPEDAADVQPARAAAGSLVLVGDLRIDNRAELATALPVDDRVDVPDSTFALAAYERWGEGFLDRIVGPFALAVLDLRQPSILLARDHLGLRPLAVHERPGTLAFASNALSLASFAGAGGGLDMQRMAELLALGYASERTLVEGVRWVAPGEAVRITPSGTRGRSWWRPERIAIREDEPPEAFERDLREALDLAVGSMARGGPVGVMSSGGLDSTSVAASAAAQLAPATVTTYTSAPRPAWRGEGMPGLDPDESPLVRDLAALHPNLCPVFVHVEPGRKLLDHHERLWELGAGPVRNPCNAIWAYEILARAAADGVPTLLTGSFGNYFFSAAGQDWLVALLRARRFAELSREVAVWAERTGQTRRRVLRRNLVTRLPLPALRRVKARLTRAPDRSAGWLRNTALRPELAVGLGLHELLPQLDASRPRDTRDDAIATAVTGSTQAEHDLAAEAYFGVAQRDPTADKRVIEASLTQPEWVRRRGGIGRAVARGAMTDRLPRSIRERRTRGDQLPDWLELMTAARAELATELDAMQDHEPSRELIDVARLRRLFEAWPGPERSGDPQTALTYRHLLFRAVLVSRYMRWFDQRAGSLQRERV
jgi:asparagine synthase (glutamine-hydrolysing)